MAPLYKKALIIGATSGIGEALAAKLLSEGTSVIVTGRRQERLDGFISAHSTQANGATAHAVNFDVTQLSSLPDIAQSITKEHPDLDCIVLNSGVQRAFDFTKPGSVDLKLFNDEMTTNYLASVHLVTAFLPHLQQQQRQTHLVFISASLGLVPFLLRTPGYNATKAALHSWITAFRQQLKDDTTGKSKHIRVVEVFPPAVQTELHDTKHQPDLQNGGEIGMPLAPYTEKMYEGLQKGEEQFAIGPAEPWLAEGGFEKKRQEAFEQQHPVITGALAKFLKSQ